MITYLGITSGKKRKRKKKGRKHFSSKFSCHAFGYLKEATSFVSQELEFSIFDLLSVELVVLKPASLGNQQD